MNIRRPYAAGSFYPGTEEALKQTVQSYLDEAELPQDLPEGELLALMAPHAGFLYSAAVAAPAYKLLPRSDCDTIVIIGHDFGPQAGEIIAVMDDHDAFDTPLGSVPVDTEMIHALEALDNRFIVHNRIHSQEHSVEIHLPFIKILKPNVKIVPMFFGNSTPSNCRDLATALKKVAADRSLLIFASTDLSHYPPYDVAKELDKDTTALIEAMDLPGLCARQKGKGVHIRVDTPICSAGGVGTAIAWCEFFGPCRARILHHANSGDVPGTDHSRVVGYASAAFFRK